MSLYYTRWIYHGEAFSDFDSHSEGHGAYESDNDEEFYEPNENNYVDDSYNMFMNWRTLEIKVLRSQTFFQSYWRKPRESFMSDPPLILGWHLL
jgi:hypothetical protein